MTSISRGLYLFTCAWTLCSVGLGVSYDVQISQTSFNRDFRTLFIQPFAPSFAASFSNQPKTLKLPNMRCRVFHQSLLARTDSHQQHVQLRASSATAIVVDANQQNSVSTRRKYAKSSSEFIVHVIQELITSAHSVHKKYNIELIKRHIRRRNAPDLESSEQDNHRIPGNIRSCSAPDLGAENSEVNTLNFCAIAI